MEEDLERWTRVFERAGEILRKEVEEVDEEEEIEEPRRRKRGRGVAPGPDERETTTKKHVHSTALRDAVTAVLVALMSHDFHHLLARVHSKLRDCSTSPAALTAFIRECPSTARLVTAALSVGPPYITLMHKRSRESLLNLSHLLVRRAFDAVKIHRATSAVGANNPLAEKSALSPRELAWCLHVPVWHTRLLRDLMIKVGPMVVTDHSLLSGEQVHPFQGNPRGPEREIVGGDTSSSAANRSLGSVSASWLRNSDAAVLARCFPHANVSTAPSAVLAAARSLLAERARGGSVAASKQVTSHPALLSTDNNETCSLRSSCRLDALAAMRVVFLFAQLVPGFSTDDLPDIALSTVPAPHTVEKHWCQMWIQSKEVREVIRDVDCGLQGITSLTSRSASDHHLPVSAFESISTGLSCRARVEFWSKPEVAQEFIRQCDSILESWYTPPTSLCSRGSLAENKHAAPSAESSGQPTSRNGSQQEIFEVEKVLDHRFDQKTGLDQFLVKWKNYDEQGWEPWNHLNCPDRIWLHFHPNDSDASCTHSLRTVPLPDISSREALFVVTFASPSLAAGQLSWKFLARLERRLTRSAVSLMPEKLRENCRSCSSRLNVIPRESLIESHDFALLASSARFYGELIAATSRQPKNLQLTLALGAAIDSKISKLFPSSISTLVLTVLRLNRIATELISDRLLENTDRVQRLEKGAQGVLLASQSTNTSRFVLILHLLESKISNFLRAMVEVRELSMSSAAVELLLTIFSTPRSMSAPTSGATDRCNETRRKAFSSFTMRFCMMEEAEALQFVRSISNELGVAELVALSSAVVQVVPGTVKQFESVMHALEIYLRAFSRHPIRETLDAILWLQRLWQERVARPAEPKENAPAREITLQTLTSLCSETFPLRAMR